MPHSSPRLTSIRYVRLQLEGFNFLHVAQVEVFGTVGASASVGRCGDVQCGKHVTIATVPPKSDPLDVEKAYCRAAKADAGNTDILRQLETYALAYDKHGRGQRIQPCVMCRFGAPCEVCHVMDKFKDDLDKVMPDRGKRRPTLEKIAKALMGAPKPPIEEFWDQVATGGPLKTKNGASALISCK